MILWTYDWVPQGPRGYVREIRLRWAMKEAGIPYAVNTVSFKDRGPDHTARQPFAQIPFLEDGDITVFESGACLLYLGRKSEILMPRDPKGEAETTEWVVAALNSIEMVAVPFWFVNRSKPDVNPLSDWLHQRLGQLETVLSARDFLAAARFTIADLLMTDVLRGLNDRGDLARYPALRAYVYRFCARPAFIEARAEQIAHFAKADGTSAAG